MSDIKKQIFLLITFFIGNLVFAQVIPITPYGIPASSDYTVLVNGGQVFTASAGNYSFCTFDFDESVTVRVTTPQPMNQIKILPTSLDIIYTVINNKTFEFTLGNPEMITVQINGDLNDVLHLLTSAPETNVPNPGDPNVLYYAGPGEYNIGVLELQDNETLYIEGNAKLNGMIFTNGANNVKIRGRGIIDGTNNNTSGNYPGGEQPWRLIYMVNSQNIDIQGITLYNSKRWTIHTYQCTNLNIDNIRILNWAFGSDGTDLSSCQDVTITNSFYKTNDDGIVIKAISFAPNSYWPNPMVNNMDVSNVLVQGCTMWNMVWGSPFEIGYELRCDRVSNIIYRDCDIIRAGGRGAVLSVHNTDHAIVENVLYENIRIENADARGIGDQLFNLAIFYSLFSYDSYWGSIEPNFHWDNVLAPWLPNYGITLWRGQINNVTYRDIEVLDGNFPYSIFYGWDSAKKINGVLLDNVIVNGQQITSVGALDLWLNSYADNIQFLFNDGDVNNDMMVNSVDFSLFRLQWPDTGCGTCGGADFTGEGDVTIDDLNIMAQSFLTDYTLMGYWPLDGNALDSSWYGNNGTDYGGPGWDPNGQVDGALIFDGLDDYLETDVTNYKGVLGTQPRTCAAWIKTTGTAGSIISWGNTNSIGNKWFLRVHSTGQLRIEVQGGYKISSTIVNDGNWNHVAAVLVNDGSPNVDEVKLYINGIEETVYSSISSQPINTASGTNVSIGAALYTSPTLITPFTGGIDDVRIYSRALSDAEIQVLAGMGN